MAPKVLVRGRRWAMPRQELEGVPLLLQRIRLRLGPAVDLNALGLHLGRLPLAGDARTSPMTVTLHPTASFLISAS